MSAWLCDLAGGDPELVSGFVAFVGGGVVLCAGIAALAGAVALAVWAVRSATLDAVLLFDMSEAFREWRARHPKRAARYGGGEPF